MKFEQNRILIGDIPAAELAERFGTPLYVYDEQKIRRAREVRKFAKERFKDWTEDDNKRIFHNADAG